jgi:hypothetical protein
VVTLSRFCEARELARLGPVELARVYDDTSNGGTVASNPLGSTVHDDICAVLDWVDNIAAGTEGVVDDQGNPMVVGDLHGRQN